jgi:hypothetical protein
MSYRKPKSYHKPKATKKFIVIDEEASMKEHFSDPIERRKYEEELEKSVNAPGFMEALYSYYMNRDISNFDPNVIPEGLKVTEIFK